MRSGYPLLTVIGIGTMGAAFATWPPQDDVIDASSAVTVNISLASSVEKGAASSASTTVAPYTDHRAWQHGLDLVKVGPRHLLVWSSWGDTPDPTPNPGGNWSHDVYYSCLDPNNPEVNPKTLVSAPEAQEPASTAINSNGRILMSCEDGNPDISQRAGMWDANLNPIKEYGTLVHDGGHSGHVAAMGNRFVVAYSYGWVDGGGVDNLGTGDDVLARIVNDDGTMSRAIPVSVNQAADKRDWWPVIAASPTDALEVWQRYPAGTLHGAFIRPDGTSSEEFKITDGIKFYYYNVRWLPSLNRYVVFGSRQDGGFISIIDRNGSVAVSRTGLPDTVRESKLVVRKNSEDGKSGVVTAIYPTLPSGAAVVSITAGSIDLQRSIPASYKWDYMGTDGMFVAPNRILFATLSKTGLRLVPMNL